MNFIRAVLHMVWMAVTVIPWALFVVLVSYFISSTRLYWICAAWLRLAVNSGTWILGIQNRIHGMENLPQGSKDPAVLLVKHQSTWETFVMPAIMPHPVASASFTTSSLDVSSAVSTCNFPITRFLNWRLSSKLKPVVSK